MSRQGDRGSARSAGRGRGPRRGRGRPRDPEALARARAARKEARRAEAEARRRAEAEEQARRAQARERPREAIEPDVREEPGAPFRAGSVALVGRPNVGKSTLLNALLGQKLAATTHKPQTTRKNLLGVLNPPGAQILLLDTPGHHQAKGPLNRFMVAQAEEAVREADVVGLVLEARADARVTPGNERVLAVLEKAAKPVVVALNKVDLVADKSGMLHQIATITERLGDRLAALVPISARKGAGLAELVVELARALPEQGSILPEGEVTDQSERDIVGEFIREKAMIELQDELPYSVAVTLERFEDARPRLLRVMATLHVERPSQKGIVIGKGGTRLKIIGARARKDIEFLVGCKTFLQLQVRVTPGWSQDQRQLEQLGYRRDRDPSGSTADEVAAAIASLPEEVLAAIEAEVEAEEDAEE